MATQEGDTGHTGGTGRQFVSRQLAVGGHESGERVPDSVYKTRGSYGTITPSAASDGMTADSQHQTQKSQSDSSLS